MELYRVHPWVHRTVHSAPYGPLHIPPGQGSGRWDNPDLYQLRYFSSSPAGAIAETFGSLAQWSESMFKVPANPDARRALSAYVVPDDVRLVDLEDPKVLVNLGVSKVTEITTRNVRSTQRLSARIFESGVGSGLEWWSCYHPELTLVAIWSHDGLECKGTTPLAVDSQAVTDAADLILRTIR